MNYSKEILDRKKVTLIFKTFKEKMIQKFHLINDIEINVLTYYYFIKNKENKLFSLIINETYHIFIQFFKVSLRIKRNNRISVNKLYSYDFIIKYKKCCKSYILRFV